MLYPAIYDPEYAKFSGFVDYLEKNPKALQKDHVRELAKKLDKEDKMILESLSDNQTLPVGSKNIDDLWNLSSLVLEDCNKVLHPIFTGDIVEDALLRNDVANFYQKRIRQYASSIAVIIDALILIDNYPTLLFRNYKTLEELVLNTAGDESALYLRRLVSIARSAVPSEVRMVYHEVIESGITSGSNPPDAPGRT